jgi:hypothetical protein
MKPCLFVFDYTPGPHLMQIHLVRYSTSARFEKNPKIFTLVRSFLKYSRVHISSDEVFSKILKKPSTVQKKIIPHVKALFFIR